MKENVAKKSKQAKLASKNDIAEFVKKTDFHKKLRTILNKVIPNKTRHVETEKMSNDHITSSQNLINEIDKWTKNG